MTAPTPQPISDSQAPDRTDLIDALASAYEAKEGRWGTRYATAVLDAHDAAVQTELMARNAELTAENAALTKEMVSVMRLERAALQDSIDADERVAAALAREQGLRAGIAAWFRTQGDKAEVSRRRHTELAISKPAVRDFENEKISAHYSGYGAAMKSAAVFVEAMSSDIVTEQIVKLEVRPTG